MIVGIPGWLVGPNSFGVTIPYLEFIRNCIGADDICILLPESPVRNDLDLLILPGGADINPLRYGEIPSVYTDKPDLFKEYFDVHVLPRYIEQYTPIFGICRGLQALAVHFGGKLHQSMDHETNEATDPYKGVHNLIVPGNNKKIRVNSRHHQSIVTPDDSSPIKVIAVHEKRTVHVEAIRIQGYPITAVQYHPEDLDEDSGVEYALRLISEIIEK